MYNKVVAPNGKEYKVAVGSLSNLRTVTALIPKMENFTVDSILAMPAVIDELLGEGSYKEIFGQDDDVVAVMKFSTELIKLVTEGFKAKISEYNSEDLNEPADTQVTDNGQVREKSKD